MVEINTTEENTRNNRHADVKEQIKICQLLEMSLRKKDITLVDYLLRISKKLVKEYAVSTIDRHHICVICCSVVERPRKCN